MAAKWFVYLLECRNGALYCGITTDVGRRFTEHQSGKGARYTRLNPPLAIVAVKEYPDRSSASKAEWQVKKLPRARKVAALADTDICAY